MGFDFKRAIEDAKKELNNNQVAAIVLGPSGSGKSSLLGTFGVKTLYLYTTGEDHGAKAAKVQGSENIVPLCIDYEDGQKLDADDAFHRLLDVLGESAAIKEAGFQAVSIDGATELEAIIRGTSAWKAACQTDKGKHNTFQEPAATLAMFKRVMDKLKGLQREIGIHYAMTCILDVKVVGDDGEVLESTPRLTGYSVAEGLIQQFPDVMVVGRMSKNDKIAHRIQMLAGVSKTSKDQAGVIKRCINFTPRITGVAKLANTYEANLAKIVELKCVT